eukprot:c52150_g1_i1.p1 GENE.c52150_g1_i1~~c52150_g1_i1.p1  ORF type:complete len:507 (+),score=86.55 c52150_g1_i1:29-1549(+)
MKVGVRHAIFLGGYVVLFGMGWAEMTGIVQALYPGDTCAHFNGTSLPLLPCEIEGNSTAFNPRQLPPTHLRTISAPLMFLVGASFTFLSYLFLYFQRRKADYSLSIFLLRSVSCQTIQLLTICTASIACMYIISNRNQDWLRILVLLHNPHLSATAWQELLAQSFCILNPYIPGVIIVSEFFSCGSLSVDFFLYMLACIFLYPKDPKMCGSMVDRLIDALCTLLQLWAWPITKHVPGLRFVNLFALTWAIRLLRFNRVFASLDSRWANKIVSLANPAVRLQQLHLLLGFKFTKIFCFLLGGTLLVISLEGIPCQYQVPIGISPCHCHDELRESFASLYFIFTTVATVGYGDLFPVTTAGRAILMVFMVSGIAVLPDRIQDIITHMRTIGETRLEVNKPSRLYRSVPRTSATFLDQDGKPLSTAARASMAPDDSGHFPMLTSSPTTMENDTIQQLLGEKERQIEFLQESYERQLKEKDNQIAFLQSVIENFSTNSRLVGGQFSNEEE